MQTYLPACKIVTTHGVRGEMKALPLCDGAAFLSKFKRLYKTAEGSGETPLLGVRAQGNMLLVRLGGYFIDDLLGCRVLDAETGAVYGAITAVEPPAAHDVYTVTDAAGIEHLFPAVEEFLDRVDLDGRAVYVRPIPGMFTEAVNGDEE